MRKIIAGLFMSLDGVIEGPGSADDFELAGWTEPYWEEAIASAFVDLLQASDALLMGRVTYQSYAGAFSSAPEEDLYGSAVNNLPKYVVSTTLKSAEWENSILIKENVAEEIATLKQQPGKDIIFLGGVQLVHFLARHDLVDEYRLWVYPVVLGKGKRLFPDELHFPLDLIETTPLDRGVVALIYNRAGIGEQPQ